MTISVIEEIKARLRLEDLASRHTRLRKAGRLLVGLCPFHEEKTPSFYVDPRRQRFSCYGCGAHGDVIDFIALTRGLDPGRALEDAASLAGVSLRRDPLYPEGRAHLEREARERQEQRRCREIARRAARKAEWGLRPRDVDKIGTYDRLWRAKDRLDAGLPLVEDREGLHMFIEGLRAWRLQVEELLAGLEGDRGSKSLQAATGYRRPASFARPQVLPRGGAGSRVTACNRNRLRR